jgi:hypothetical protein
MHIFNKYERYSENFVQICSMVFQIFSIQFILIEKWIDGQSDPVHPNIVAGRGLWWRCMIIYVHIIANTG